MQSSILFIIDCYSDLIKSLFLYFSGADRQLTRSWNIVCSPVLLNICADWSLHLEHRNRRTMNHHEAQKTDGPFWGGGGARHGVTQFLGQVGKLSTQKMQNIPVFCWKPPKKPILSMKNFLKRIFYIVGAGSLPTWPRNWVTPWRAPPPPQNGPSGFWASCWC